MADSWLKFVFCNSMDSNSLFCSFRLSFLPNARKVFGNSFIEWVLEVGQYLLNGFCFVGIRLQPSLALSFDSIQANYVVPARKRNLKQNSNINHYKNDKFEVC